MSAVCDVFILKSKKLDKIQLRFNVQKNEDLVYIPQFLRQSIYQLNISVFEQQYDIEKSEIVKEKYLCQDESGDLYSREEFVLIVYD
jgi:hypothetical protein